jgi:hypothetical protein
LARELADVLHYFLPDGAKQRTTVGSSGAPGAASAAGLTPLAVPIGERDLVRVAFVWNLAVELARGSRGTLLLMPDDPAFEPLRECLPAPANLGEGAPELAFSHAEDLRGLGRDASELTRTARPGAPVLAPVLIPARWIRPDPEAAPLLRHALLFATPEPTELNATQALLERIFEAAPHAEPGVTIHGVDSIEEAERTFDRLALRCETSLGRPLRSYGLLLDDLQVYRAVVDRRSVAAAQPHSPAARALADVARLLRADHEAPPPGEREAALS